MAFSTLMAFVAALAVALAVPGPDFVLVVQSATHSTRRGLATACGIVAGLCLHAMLAIAGLAAVLASIPGSFALLRIIGAAVLLWFGVSMIRSWRSPHENQSSASDSNGFLRGFLTNATNPKALLFFAAVLPQFIGTGPAAGVRTAILAFTVVAGATLWWAGTVAVIRITGVHGSPRSDRIITLCGGIALTVIALVLTTQVFLESGIYPV